MLRNMPQKILDILFEWSSKYYSIIIYLFFQWLFFESPIQSIIEWS